MIYTVRMSETTRTLQARRDQWALLLEDLPHGIDRPERTAMRALKSTIEDALLQPGDVLRITLPTADAGRVLRSAGLAG